MSVETWGDPADPAIVLIVGENGSVRVAEAADPRREYRARWLAEFRRPDSAE